MHHKITTFTKAEIDGLIQILIQKIGPYSHNISCVVGIANGGLYVSRPLAKSLCLPHSQVRISRYEGSQLRDTPIIEGKPPAGRLLIVDDLVDNGGTMRMYDEKFGLSGHMTAVLFCKLGGFIPDFFAAIKPSGWIIFPWDCT